MKKALKLMLDRDGVATLPDCVASKGAEIEMVLAEKLGITIAEALVREFVSETQASKTCEICKHKVDSKTIECINGYSFICYADGTVSCHNFKRRRQ